MSLSHYYYLKNSELAGNLWLRNLPILKVIIVSIVSYQTNTKIDKVSLLKIIINLQSIIKNFFSTVLAAIFLTCFSCWLKRLLSKRRISKEEAEEGEIRKKDFTGNGPDVVVNLNPSL